MKTGHGTVAMELSLSHVLNVTEINKLHVILVGGVENQTAITAMELVLLLVG